MSYSISLFRKFLIASTIFLSFPALHSADGGEEGQGRQFQCPYCRYTCGFQAVLTKHLKKHRQAQENFVKCSVCHNFFTEREIENHIRKKCKTGGRDFFQYFCSKCDSGFSSHQGLAVHITRKCPEAECVTRNLQPEAMTTPAAPAPTGQPRHLVDYRPGETLNTFACRKPGCPRYFANPAMRSVHEQKCTPEKPINPKFFHCPHCGPTRINERRRHNFLHQNQDFHFECSRCGAVFQNNIDCDDHIRDEHEGIGCTIEALTIPPLAPLEEDDDDDDEVPPPAPL